ncbi:MAG: glycoside hydrolase family 25 protein [Hansschlegelia sp.]
MFNGLIDLSHHNAVDDWAAAKADGVVAVVHKATEGTSFRDAQYRRRRDEAKAHGLLWGSYHFSSGVEAALQVENYLAYAEPAPDELVCLDVEESSSGPDMTHDQMAEFVSLIRERIGRPPVIYGGRFLRETMLGVASSPLSDCALWYARYAPQPIGVPEIWDAWTLWQYTDGAAGNQPHRVAGIGAVDRSLFNGDERLFRARWPF